MTKTLLAITAGFTLTAALWAQKQPQPKSQKEVEALMAIQSAADPDARIKAAEDLLTKFADTEFKEFALQMETISYQQKNDFENMVITGERTLEANPDNVVVLITLAQSIPQRTKEFDLDKEEKLSKSEKFAKKAQTLIPNLAKYNPQISDDDWAGYKKSAMSQAHEAVGMVAFTRKNYAAAEQNMRKAVELGQAQPDAVAYWRLALALDHQSKYPEALQVVNQADQLSPQEPVASLVKQEQARLKKLAPPGAAAPTQPAAATTPAVPSAPPQGQPQAPKPPRP